jgi:hypothetical protein|tara:strand:- start:1141 stop:1431 length:291 start_codon:yes stop_codon:yes gene_type:complete
MIDDNIGFSMGNITVETTNNKGHDVEFWAEKATNRICGISEQAAPHIKEQALAFRTAIYGVILNGMRSAIASDRTTVSNKFKNSGHADIANILKEM